MFDGVTLRNNQAMDELLQSAIEIALGIYPVLYLLYSIPKVHLLLVVLSREVPRGL